MHDLTPSKPRSSTRILAFVAGGLVALIALAALALAVGVFIGRGKVESKLAAMGERFGLRVEVGEVDLPLVGAIGARDVRVFAKSGEHIATIDRIETDLTLADAVTGTTRPSRVVLRGGHLDARIVDGRPVDLEPQPSQDTPASDGTTDAISLALADVEVRLSASQQSPLGSGRLEIVPVVLHVDEVELARDAHRQITAAARGTWRLASGDVPFTAELDTAQHRLAAHLDGSGQLGIATPWGSVWVTLRDIERDPGRDVTRVDGLEIVRGEDHFRAARVAVTGAGDAWLPDRAALQSVALEGIDARHGGRSLVAQKLVVGLAHEPGAELPSPRSVSIDELRGETPDPLTGGALRAEATEIAIGFEALQEHLGKGTPLDAVTSLRLVRPKATLVVPPRPDVPTTSDVAKPDDDDDPLPVIIGAAEDELAASAAKKPTNDQSFAFLDRLFGDPSGKDTHDPELADFLPGAWKARAREIVPRLRALRPEIRDGFLEVVDTAGKTLLALDGAGFATSTGEDGLLQVSLRAAVSRAGKPSGNADLTLALDDGGVIQWAEGTLAGTDLANRFAAFVPGLTVQPDAALDLDIRYDRPRSADAPHHVAGTIAVANFTFQFWRISDREVDHLQAKAAFDLIVDRKGRRLLLNLPELAMGAARFSGSLDLKKPVGKLPAFTARLTMPKQDCGKAAASIPKALIPNLSTLEMTGEMNFDASIVLDLENPKDLDLAVTGDISKCRVLSLGPGIDLMALQGDFIHHPREPVRGELDNISVGRGTSQWIPSERLPDIVKLAAWTTEDRGYTAHAGVSWTLVERALKIDLIHGRFVYGGSTITQQLVKNLYLTRTKHLARKFEEAIIAMQMERVLTKDEILTIYINCIEYGPDIYGVKHAARFYFDKKVDELDALEAAFIMGLKPFPKAGYHQWQKGVLDDFWIRRVSHVLDLMAKFGPQYITADEAHAFAPYQPKFRREQ